MSKITDDCSAQKEAYVVDNFEYILFYIRFGKKEGISFLFIDSFNTFLFYLRIYGVRHMVKDNSDSKRGNPLLIPISSKDSFICTISQTE